ncbi:MAG: hypothetical protein CMO74_11840 [Verrucomicrobiales bacterium]|nr:hypothetical protein [Verrucomicrobiales bacterium]MBL69123.1 hypothetical protein [Verrucomicrobiales bacterium]
MKRKFSLFAMLAMASVLVTGCTGIRASGSISPWTFLLPGFVKNETPPKSPAAKEPHVALR